ncbi:MAG: hypothetical protein QME92_05630 [Bacillota bacterium]|nr:hypothetical protein [Bacillota bacterium]
MRPFIDYSQPFASRRSPVMGRRGGGGQLIWRDSDTGVFICGSEPRKDGLAVAW